MSACICFCMFLGIMKYMLGLLLILISKSKGGISPALLSAGAMCVCMYLGGCLN